MKHFTPIMLLLLLIGAFSTVAVAQDDKKSSAAKSKFVKAKFDKGKNTTTISLKTLDLGGSMAREVGNLESIPQLDLDASFSYEGDQLKQPVEAVTLVFKTFARYPVYQRPQNVVGVLDDERALVLGTTNYKSNSKTFGIEEIMTISVPFEAMKRIAEAKFFKFILGGREIRFREKEHEALRELARSMSPAS